MLPLIEAMGSSPVAETLLQDAGILPHLGFNQQ